MLNVWPPFPIEINSSNLGDNIVAALEHHDRICQINLLLTKSEFERLATVVMQKPFPILTTLHLSTHWSEHMPVLFDMFLGGSAPRLRSLCLYGLILPALPQLFLSCNDLSELRLHMSDIGDSSPEAMATGLSALTRLTHLNIQFGQSGTIRRPPPLAPTRALLPALTQFEFRGANEYLEDLLIRIDTPQLEGLKAMFHQNVLDIRQVISHTRTFGPFDRADVTFGHYRVNLELSQSEETDPRKSLELGVIEDSDAPGQQVSSMAQICTQSSSLLSGITRLDIGSDALSAWDDLEDLMDNPEWLVVFRQFTAVQTLCLFGRIYIVSSLRLGGHTGEQSVTEVLLSPELQHLYLYRSDCRDELEETLELFVAARQQSDHPVAIHRLPYNCD
ncbi:hypothetical protein BGW80DRAFT_1352238 [Lactifluus volemus]|nr:hypothetical protein BGW80DRAFT_1352238 [Lactifluus volemus]